MRLKRWSRLLVATSLAVAVLLLPRLMFREHLSSDRTFFRNSAPVQGRQSTGHVPTTLVVIFHGLAGSHKALADVFNVVHEAMPTADVLFPEYPASLLSNEDPAVVTGKYVNAISEAFRANQYTRIVLIGHSFGGLIARRAYLCARLGCSASDAELVRRPTTWWPRVERFILLAGMNRGWETHCDKERLEQESDCRAERISPAVYALAELGQRVAGPLGVSNFIMSGRRGAPFVANLRLDWLRVSRAAGSEPLPAVVQLLGTADDVVSRSDNTDTLVAGSFVFKEFPDTDHLSAARLRETGHEDRERVFREALLTPAETLASLGDYFPRDERKIDPTVKSVVFVVHGIRDEGDWAVPLGQMFEAQSKPGEKIVALYRSYGYFPALHFLLKNRMQENVRWFVDQYTEQVALYPNASISFVGHSNGTYVLANALRDYQAVRFDRGLLAGTVVPTGFDWNKYVRQGRIHAIRNLIASNDKVVALLPAFFEYFPSWLDVGSAGHNGFTDEEGRRYETRYIKGGHSAALNGANYQAIINFILNRSGCVSGHMPPREVDCPGLRIPSKNLTDSQDVWAVQINRFCVVIWFGIIVLLLGGLAGLSYKVVSSSTYSHTATPAGRLLYLMPGAIYLLIIFAVLRYV